MRLGHRSDSTNSARSGRQWSRKRVTNCGASSGTNWCRTPAGRRCSASAAEVTVPEVTSTAKSARGCARSAEPPRAFRRRWRHAPRSRARPGAAGSLRRGVRPGAWVLLAAIEPFAPAAAASAASRRARRTDRRAARAADDPANSTLPGAAQRRVFNLCRIRICPPASAVCERATAAGVNRLSLQRCGARFADRAGGADAR